MTRLTSISRNTLSLETLTSLLWLLPRSSVRALISFGAAGLVISAAAVLSQSQSIQYTQDKADQTLRSTMRVDPSTLGLSIQVPLAGYPGRGGASLPINLSYSSKQWRLDFESSWLGPGGSPRTQSHPKFSEWAKAGWTTSLDIPVIEWTGRLQVYNSDGNAYCTACADIAWSDQLYINRMQVHLPGGGSHELRTNDIAVSSLAYAGTYYAVDGSNLRYEANAAGEGTLFLPDGSRYLLLPSTTGYQFIDRNGNRLSYSASNRQWTDTLGRVFDVPAPTSPAAQAYTYYLPSTSSTPLSYQVRWSTLGNALTNQNDSLRYQTQQLPGSGSDDSYSTHSPYLFSGTTINRVFDTSGTFNPVVLAEIVLPNGQSYLFTYNVWGEITKVVYPTGAYERFDYDVVTGNSFSKAPYTQGNRGVVERWLSATGNSADEVHWHYSTAASSGVLTVSTTAPDGTLTERRMTAETEEGNATCGFSNPLLGMAFDERVYEPSGVGGAMLRRALTEWAVSGTTSGGWSTATRNPRVSKQVEILLDTHGPALAKTTIHNYDFTYELSIGLIETAVSEYDWVPLEQSTAQTVGTGSFTQGNLLGDRLRTQESTNLLLDTNISQSVRDAYRARNLVGLTTSTRIKDGQGNILAQSATGYDQTARMSLGSVASWVDPQSDQRGNATTIGRWLNTTNSYVQTLASYDQFGNARTTTDANGKQTSIDYASSYQYAYPTTTTTAVPDPNGINGSSVAFSSSTNYNLNTGAVVASTDANGITSTAEYNDSWNRPTRAVRASGNSAQNQSPIIYDDANRLITGKSDLEVFNDSSLKSETLYDKLGRAIEARQYEGGTNYIAVQTEYDALGRPYKVSNPFRPWKSETPVWTISSFDALGRVTAVTTPDGAQVQTAYAGSATGTKGTTVLVTDQKGRQRISVTNALGQLSDVWEIRSSDPASGTESVSFPEHAEVTAGYHTSYTYDVLGNLLTVTQGSQTRTFVYDSLSRLQSATNPESGTICYGRVISGQCQPDGYDGNGNLIYKTDARGVRTNYGYDALNRNISVTYTNDPANTPAVSRTYDNPAVGMNGLGRLWKTETAGTARATVDEYDALGRPKTQRQQFFRNNAWSGSFTSVATYDKAGHLLTETYPSGHATSYNYDAAGRLADKDGQHLAFTGNLGDGVPRTYAAGLSYTSLGGMEQEKFGTEIPLYHKQRYNQRGQLWDMRLSTVPFASDPANGDRGALVNHYSNAYTQGGSGSDNNGNLLRQEIYLPGNGFFQDNFDYDSLNRLSYISEKLNGAGSNTFKQAYRYDRYGNRSLDYNATSANLPRPQFDIDPNTNRLTVPSGQSATMHYDAAGNLDIDTYSGLAISRLYDAENRMTQETQANALAGNYTYDGDGRRLKRIVNGVETWQVYGLGGELLAEYAMDASPTTPQREYGYRNGQLLVTAEAAPATGRTNVALAANGGVATAQNYTQDGYYPGQNLHFQPSYANDGSRYMGANGDRYWRDEHGVPTSIEIAFSGSKTIDEIDVFTCRDDYATQADPSATQTFSNYGTTSFQVQYWNGSSWVGAPGGSFSGNNLVWRKLTFSALTTTKIKVIVSAAADNVARLMEVEAWSGSNPGTPAKNMALVSNGGVATAQNYTQDGYYPGQDFHFQPSYANDGTRYMGANGDRYWRDEHGVPTWIEVAFSGAKTIDEIDVFTCRDDYATQSDPSATQTFSNYGTTSFQVQYWNGSSWVAVTGGSITGNNLVWRKVTFSAVTTTKIKVTISATPDNVARLMEVEAWGYETVNVRWLVTDHLGTPRLVADGTGTAAGIARHDYLPFGDELPAVFRNGVTGYNSTYTVRQKFTQKERDNETGLDYFLARYYSSTQGRFTSPDEFSGGPDELFVPNNENQKQALPYAEITRPQSLNKYTYVYNSPGRFIDPDGHCGAPSGLQPGQVGICVASYIRTKWFMIIGRGDGRDTNGQGGTSRVEVRVIVNVSKGTVTKTDEVMARSGVVTKNAGLQASGASRVSEPNTDKQGNLYFQINQHGDSSMNLRNSIGTIDNHLNMVVTPDNKAGITPDSTARAFPSLEVYKYAMDAKGNVTTILILTKTETDRSALKKPELSVQADPK